MKVSNKTNLAAGIILLLLAAFFSIALLLQPLDFGQFGPGKTNFLFQLGEMLASVYGFTSILIPVFLFTAAISCFASNWTARKSMRLLTAAFPFFTSFAAEKLIKFFLAEADGNFIGLKIAVTLILAVMLIVIEFLIAGIIADKISTGGNLKKSSGKNEADFSFEKRAENYSESYEKIGTKHDSDDFPENSENEEDSDEAEHFYDSADFSGDLKGTFKETKAYLKETENGTFAKSESFDESDEDDEKNQKKGFSRIKNWFAEKFGKSDKTSDESDDEFSFADETVSENDKTVSESGKSRDENVADDEKNNFGVSENASPDSAASDDSENSLDIEELPNFDDSEENPFEDVFANIKIPENSKSDEDNETDENPYDYKIGRFSDDKKSEKNADEFEAGNSEPESSDADKKFRHFQTGRTELDEQNDDSEFFNSADSAAYSNTRQNSAITQEEFAALTGFDDEEENDSDSEEKDEIEWPDAEEIKAKAGNAGGDFSDFDDDFEFEPKRENLYEENESDDVDEDADDEQEIEIFSQMNDEKDDTITLDSDFEDSFNKYENLVKENPESDEDDFPETETDFLETEANLAEAETDFPGSETSFPETEIDFAEEKKGFYDSEKSFEELENNFEDSEKNIEASENDFEESESISEDSERRFEEPENDFKESANNFEDAENDFEDSRSNFEKSENDFEDAQNNFGDSKNNFEKSEKLSEESKNYYSPSDVLKSQRQEKKSSLSSEIFDDMEDEIRKEVKSEMQQKKYENPAFDETKSNRAMPKKAYSIPTELLEQYSDDQYWIVDDETKRNAVKLTDTLTDFGISAEVIGIKKGPVVTMYELEPAPGVRLSKIVSLQDNIALSLAASSVRIVAPIPGRAAVGIEVPNKKRSIVSFREMIEQDLPEFKKMAIPVVLGKDILGKSQIIDIAKTPHLLIAGATGAGKSVCVNSIILSILYKRSPQQVKMILVDPKVVELKLYNDIPHLLTPVITDPKRALQSLQWCLCEMERRYAQLDNMGVRDIASYNNRIEERKICTEKLPYIVIIIDEFADLMATSGKELESNVARLAAMSRAVGIHLVLATQRPSVNVITGLIKANIPSRIAFMVASRTDSNIIIDAVGAEKLLGKGDMLYASAISPYPVRIQGTFESDNDVENVVDYVKTLGEPDYIDDQMFFDDEEDDNSPTLFSDSAEDPLYEQALDIVIQAGKASASYIQRRLKIGYNRAARLVEEMEERGIVGPANGSKPREVIHIPN